MDGKPVAGEMPASFALGQVLVWGGAVALQPALSQMDEVAVAPGSLPSLAKALERVPEHRRPRGFKAHQPPYPLIPLLLLLLVGLLAGRRGYTGIAEWARSCAEERPDLLNVLGFPAGRTPRTPVPATLYRLVRDLDRAALARALQGWVEATGQALGRALPRPAMAGVPADQVAVDGKTIRGATARRGDASAAFIQLVSAYVPALQAVVDQVASGGKGQEVAAAELLLGRLPLKDRVVTGDALMTQRSVCETILEGGGTYLFPVKENQPALLADIQAAFSPPGGAGPGGADEAGCAGRASAPAAGVARCGAERGAGAATAGAARAAGDADGVGAVLAGAQRVRREQRGGRETLAWGGPSLPDSAGGE